MQSKGLSRVFSNTTVQAHQILQCSALFILQLSHPYMTTGKTIALTRWTFVDKVMSLLFNMLSRLVSAIKRNTFESVLMRWMNLEPIIQVDVNQKEKDKFCILIHIYRIYKNDTEEFIYRATMEK